MDEKTRDGAIRMAEAEGTRPYESVAELEENVIELGDAIYDLWEETDRPDEREKINRLYEGYCYIVGRLRLMRLMEWTPKEKQPKKD